MEIIVHLGLQFHVRHTSTVSAKLGKANLCRSSNLDDTNKLKLQENYKNWNIAKLRMKHRSACSQCWATTAPGTKGNREWHFLHLTGRMHLLSVVSHPWLYTILVFHCELLALPLALEHGETLYSLPSAPGSKCSWWRKRGLALGLFLQGVHRFFRVCVEAKIRNTWNKIVFVAFIDFCNSIISTYSSAQMVKLRGLFPLLSDYQAFLHWRISCKLSTSDPLQHACEVGR